MHWCFQYTILNVKSIDSLIFHLYNMLHPLLFRQSSTFNASRVLQCMNSSIKISLLLIFSFFIIIFKFSIALSQCFMCHVPSGFEQSMTLHNFLSFCDHSQFVLPTTYVSSFDRLFASLFFLPYLSCSFRVMLGLSKILILCIKLGLHRE